MQCMCVGCAVLSQMGAPAVRAVYAGRAVRGHGGPALGLTRLRPAVALVVEGEVPPLHINRTRSTGPDADLT